MGIGRWVTGEFVYVSPEKAEELSPNTTRPGDIVFTQRGTLGQVAMVPPQPYDRYVVSQSQMKLTVDPSKADATFLYYFFISEEHQEYIRNNAIQTGVPHTNLEILKRTPLCLPPLPIQRRIADILSALDDKIECNRQINRVLEAMAQTLYQHWFVDFGPFRDGEFVESELGKIPKGWRVGRLDELFVLQRGFDLPSSERISGCYPILSASGITGSHTEHKVKGPGVTTGRSGLLGKVFYINEDFWPLNTSLWVKEYKVSNPQHAYFLLSSIDLGDLNAGSAVPTLNRNDLHRLVITIPPQEVVSRFGEAVKAVFELCHTNEKESEALARTRDYLLPRLLSGEIEVKAAEQMMEVV